MVQRGVEGAEWTATAKESAKVGCLALRFAPASGVVVEVQRGRRLEGEEELLVLVDCRRKCPWDGVEVEVRRGSSGSSARAAEAALCALGDLGPWWYAVHRTMEWRRFARAEVGQVGQWSRTS